MAGRLYLERMIYIYIIYDREKVPLNWAYKYALFMPENTTE